MKRMAFALCVLVVCTAAPATAQSVGGYPVKPIRFIVPFSPGGSTDIVARMIAQPLSESLRQSVIVDNRPGAGAMIGMEATLNAPADGYTMVYATISSITMAPLLQPKVRYAVKDFTPVTLLAKFPYGLVAHPSLPARNIKSLAALARANPEKITVASAGTGTGTHLAIEYLAHTIGAKFAHIPYKSDGQALPILMGGEVMMGMFPTVASTPHVKANRLRLVAVTSATRVAAMPDVATVAESGYPGFEVTTWHGVAVRAGTSAEIVRRLNEEIVRIVRRDEFKARLTDPSGVIIGSSVEAFERFIVEESNKWRKVISDANIRL
jgi:tripartite-type tricarboxylate transporter receptor subunit TctC